MILGLFLLTGVVLSQFLPCDEQSSYEDAAVMMNKPPPLDSGRE